MFSFEAKIEIIGVNPYVLLPYEVLQALFQQAGKDKGAIQVKGKINGHDFLQNLVKYSGYWRLYLNTPMRTASKRVVGDTVSIEVQFDPEPRIVAMHPKLKQALEGDAKAKQVFDALSPSHQKEVVRYISHLKSEESIDRNVIKALAYLHGKERFIGRDAP
ncbi:MAG TPA: YdeI/OmpD-associated family protein [Flavobacterium sp.]|nr:YdeI/OmpD-associated family protein [Flavobacterium sp.]